MIDDPGDITERERDILIDLYDDEIHYTDAEIGRLLSQADEILEDWSAIITADHGEELGDHGEYSHQNKFYDETIRVPLVLYDQSSTGTHDEMVGHVDIAPTVADFAGVADQPTSFWGHSLAPFLDDEAAEWPKDGIFGGWHPFEDFTLRIQNVGVEVHQGPRHRNGDAVRSGCRSRRANRRQCRCGRNGRRGKGTTPAAWIQRVVVRGSTLDNRFN